MKLNEEQERAVEGAINAFKSNKPLYRIGGYAGTGKTTVMKEIANRIEDLGVCAYTGKAASVLTAKGVDATTIHARIYEWDKYTESFQKVPSVRFPAFGIDEGSMVGSDIFYDVKSYAKPIIAVGDPGQLEPISSKEINLMLDPDIVLEKIHRQALDNPIIDLATRIRTKKPWGKQDEDDRCIVDRHGAIWDSIDWADIVICGYNSSRFSFNDYKRTLSLKFKNKLEEGERIICLQNDKKLGVFNGLMFTVQMIYEECDDYYLCDLESDDGTTWNCIKVWTGALGKVKYPKWDVTRDYLGKMVIADYGYAITCHKAQGSEWDRVAVFNEAAPKLWCQVRWLYTAATRAAKNLRLFMEQ